jgi:hypothetical protein
MTHMDLHDRTVTDEELAVVAAAILATAEGKECVPRAATLDDTSVAAVLAALASIGVSFQKPEPPLPSANAAWRRSPYEQSVRPRWR